MMALVLLNGCFISVTLMWVLLVEKNSGSIPKYISKIGA